jgi:bifunctional non-homologous end joining protein LigD
MGTIRFGRYTVETSKEDKVFFPHDHITKGDVIKYYERVAEALLPYVKDRPLVMKRYPDGIKGDSFFQKEIRDYFPDWIDRIKVKKEGGSVTHAVCNNTGTLIYLANQACIELHPWLSRTKKLDYPDQLIIDLDPPGQDFSNARFAARALRDLLEELDLRPFLKTTGSRGLHVLVPLDRKANFDAVRRFAQDVALLLAHRHSDKLTVELYKDKRRGRLLIDTARNSYAQSAIAPYSLRAIPGAPVAAPLDWDELSDGRLDSQRFNINNLFRRLDRKADPWEGLGRSSRSLQGPRRRLNALLERENLLGAAASAETARII